MRGVNLYTVSDVKKMGYCPRFVYYHYCLAAMRPPPSAKMEAGAQANDRTEELEQRRSLRAYGLREGERQFDLWLESESLGLCGRLDMLITTPEERIPVDYKYAKAPEAGQAPYLDWQWQLSAYALLLSEQPGRAVRRGFIYAIPQRHAVQIEFGISLLAQVRAVIGQIGSIVEHESMPDVMPYRGRCWACEYRRFCNDV